ncbi:hypothetical protein ACFSNO_07395 [Streptomyces cirratus]
MLLKASRPSLAQGSKTVTDGGSIANSLVYNVPLTGANAPYKLGAADVAAWGQTDAPTDATAVFPPDAVPAGNDGSALTAAAYRRAAVTYVNASGREVNTAQPGGRISTTGYNAGGAVVYALSAANRDLALATSGPALDRLADLGIAGAGTAERAALLAETRSTARTVCDCCIPTARCTRWRAGTGRRRPAGRQRGPGAPAHRHRLRRGQARRRPGQRTAHDRDDRSLRAGRAGGDLDTRTSTTSTTGPRACPSRRPRTPRV